MLAVAAGDVAEALQEVEDAILHRVVELQRLGERLEAPLRDGRLLQPPRDPKGPQRRPRQTGDGARRHRRIFVAEEPLHGSVGGLEVVFAPDDDGDVSNIAAAASA